MDKSTLDGTDAEDRANALVKDYENALDRLRSQFNPMASELGFAAKTSDR